MPDVSIDAPTLRGTASRLRAAAGDTELDGGCVRASETALGSSEVASMLQRIADEQALRGDLTAKEVGAASSSAQDAAQQFSALDRALAGPV